MSTILSLGISDVRVSCIIGVRPDERITEQILLVDLICRYDATEAVENDRVESGLDYTELTATIREFARDGRFGLIETLAVRLADRILEYYPAVLDGELRVRKPGAVPGAGPPEVRVKLGADRT